jgi:Fe-S cluster assembly protein SufD
VESLASAFAGEGDSLEALLSRPFPEQTHAFTALNAACAEDGAFVRIPANMVIEEPIHLVFLSDPGGAVQAGPVVSHPRSLVLAGPGSRVTIVETYAGILDEVTLTNAVTEIVLEEGAAVEHYKVQNEPETAFHIALLDVRQERDTRFTTHSVALGSLLARHEVTVRLHGPGATTTLNGLYMPQNEQHLDNPTTIDHVAPECTSRELYKGVVDGRGRGVFNGRIIVRPGAMKTDSSQTNKNLLLSESARANTRPQLEIFADDVKCAHGAAVGAAFRNLPRATCSPTPSWARCWNSFGSSLSGLMSKSWLRPGCRRVAREWRHDRRTDEFRDGSGEFRDGSVACSWAGWPERRG